MDQIQNIGMLDVALGLLFIFLSLPLIYDKIPPNRWYGFRLPKSFRSTENWYAINRYGGKALAGWSFVLFLTGILKLLFPVNVENEPWGLLWIVGPLLVFCIAPLIQTLRYTSRL